MIYVPADGYPSHTSRARRIVTTWIVTNALPLSQTDTFTSDQH